MRIIIVYIYIFCSFVLLSGCSCSTNETNSIISNHKTPLADKNNQVIKKDRYILVELENLNKMYVLNQIIDVSIPRLSPPPTIKEGMAYILNQSGYSLCDTELNLLYEKTLPTIQYKMGPVRLSDALQIMAGPAWSMHVDDIERTICFTLNTEYSFKGDDSDEKY